MGVIEEFFAFSPAYSVGKFGDVIIHYIVAENVKKAENTPTDDNPLKRIQKQYKSVHVKKIYVRVPDKKTAEKVMNDVRKEANEGKDVDQIVDYLKKKYHIEAYVGKPQKDTTTLRENVTGNSTSHIWIIAVLIPIFIATLSLLKRR